MTFAPSAMQRVLSAWRSVPRAHRWGLAVILLFGALRGGFWALTTPMPGPADEAHHFAYIESIAEGDGIPIVGTDFVSADVLGLMKATPTGPNKAQASVGPPDDPSWGVLAESYEAHQSPLYYAAQAVLLRLLPFESTAAQVLVLRASSLVAALAALVVTYLLARAALPDTSVAWLGAPALLATIQGFNSNLVVVSNDALVVATSAAVLVPVAQATYRGFTRRRALVTGVLLGLAVLVKATAVDVGGLIALAVLGGLISRRVTFAEAARWCVVTLGAALVLVAPWLVFNVIAYPDESAGRIVFELVIEPLQPPIPFGFSAIGAHLRDALLGFWETQTLGPRLPYRVLLSALLAASGVVGVVLARRGGPLGAAGVRVAWLALAFPTGFIIHLIAIYVPANGGTISRGRLLYPILVPLVVAIVGAVATLVGHATLRVVSVLALALVVLEAPSIPVFLQAWYADGIAPGGLVPSVEQQWNDQWAAGEPVVIRPPCRTPRVGVAFQGPDAPLQVMATQAGTTYVPLVGAVSVGGGAGTFGQYAVRPSDDPITLQLGSEVAIGRSAVDRSSALEFVAGQGDPVASVYCPVDDPIATRFAQTFAYGHPDLSYGPLAAWRWIAVLLTLVTMLALLFLNRSERRSTATTTSESPSIAEAKPSPTP